MELEQNIKLSLKKYGLALQAPAKLDQAVNQGLLQLDASAKKRHSRIKRANFIVLIAVCTSILAAFSSPSLADRIYGSFDTVKKKVITLSLQEYQQIGFKFMGAQKELGTDFPIFEKLSKQLVASKINDSDDNQNIDYDALSPEKRAQLKKLQADIQPYFDRLNHKPVAQSVLTSEEYDAYIEAQMQRETLMAKGKVNPSKGPVQAKDLPVEYQEGYEKTVQLIQKLEDKIHQSNPPASP